MANKFTEQRKKRNAETSTEDLANRLYEDETLVEEHNKGPVIEKDFVPKKRGVGRPKLEDWEKTPSAPLSVFVPVSLKDKMRIAAAARKISLSKYVIMLIEEDLEKNRSKYEQYIELSNKISF